MARPGSRISSIAILAVIGYVILSQHTAFVNSSPSHRSGPQLRSRVRLGPLKDQIAEAEKALEILKEAQRKAEMQAAESNAALKEAQTQAEIQAAKHAAVLKEAQKQAEIQAARSDAVLREAQKQAEIQAAKNDADTLTWAARTAAEKGLPQAVMMQAKADDAVAAYEALRQGLPAPAATAPPSIAKEDCPVRSFAGVTTEQIHEAEKQAHLFAWAAKTAAQKGMAQSAELQAKALAAVEALEDLKACAGDETLVSAATSGQPITEDEVIAVQNNENHASAAPFGQPITEEEVIAVQNAWADAIRSISEVHKFNGDYLQLAADVAGELYAYGKHDVLSKPTNAAVRHFRPTPESALSCFVGYKAVDSGHDKDDGFVINGGKGWSDCAYDNHQIELKGTIAIAMGNYYLTCAATGAKSRVEYTFGYQRCDDGKVRIFEHQSSVPYKM